ncbi:hypothetical protein PYCC9005_000325 [Savitreella phatthalungensis]
MESATARFISATGNDELRNESVEQVASVISAKQASLLQFVQGLGEYLTSTDSAIRYAATQMLRQVLAALPRADLTGQHVTTMTQFFADRSDDVVCLQETLIALTDLASHLLFTSDEVDTVLDATSSFSSEIKQLPQRTRYQLYMLWQTILQRHTRQLPRLANQLSKLFRETLAGEKDPRILMAAFPLVQAVLPLVETAEETEELFDAVFCYFPITFRATGDEAKAIDVDTLKLRLRDCLTCTGSCAPHLLPALIEKLNAVAQSVKKDAMLTISAACDVYRDAELAPYARQLWDAIKYEIIQAEDSLLEDVALDTLTALTRCLSRGARHLESGGPLSSWLQGVSNEIAEQLQEPELKSAKPCGKVLKAVAVASPLCWKVLAQACTPRIRALLQEETTLSKRTSLIEVLYRILEAEARVRDEELTVPLIESSKNELIEQFRSNLLGVPVTEEDHRLLAMACIKLLLAPNSALSEKDRRTLASDLTEVAINEAGESVSEKALSDLAELAASRPQIVLDLTFPALLARLPHKVTTTVAEWDGARDTLRALSIVTNDRTTVETLMTRLFSRLDENVTEAPDQLSMPLELLNTLLSVVRRLSTSAPAILVAVGDRLLPMLFQRVVDTKYKGHELLRREEPIRVLASIINLITRVCPTEQQREYAAAALALYVTGGLSMLVTFIDDDFRPFKEEPTSASQHLTLPLFGAIYCGLRRDLVAIENLSVSLVSMAISLATILPNAYVRDSLGQLVGSLLNKAKETEEYSGILSNIQQARTNATDVRMMSWITRALVLRGHGFSKDMLLALCNDLDDAERARQAAEGLELVARNDEFLTRENHALIKPLHKQKFFAIVMPELVKRERSAKSAGQVKDACITAACSIVANMPKSVYGAQLADIFPLLVQGLDANDASCKIAVLEVLLACDSDAKDTVASHLTDLVPRLLSITSSKTSLRCKITALRVLASFPSLLRRDQLEHVRKAVILGLGTSLDSPKRLVRREAVVARHQWYQL